MSATPAVDYPLTSRPIEVNGQKPESLTCGAAVFRIPAEREFDVAKAIQVTVIEEPSKKPVFVNVALEDIEAKDLSGSSHKRTALLPFGSYSYQLADRSKDPSLGFAGYGKGTPPRLTGNRIDLTARNPVTVVDLSPIVRLKELPKDPATPAPSQEPDR